MLFSLERQSDPFCPHVNVILEFLMNLFNSGKSDGSGLGYSALSTARSALSAIATVDGQPAGQHPFVRRFMKAVFNKRPAFPRYNTTWDPDVVLVYIKNMGQNRRLSLLQLSKKLTILLLLLSGQRCQTIHQLDLQHMTIDNSKVVFQVNALLKTTRPGHHQPALTFPAYTPDKRICVLTTLRQYLLRTKDLRGDNTKLLLTTRSPVKPASRATISRWTKSIMSAAGIDMNIFSSHSTRSASTSKAAAHLPLQTIIKTVGWANQSVFAKFYKKPVSCHGSFSNAVLR